MNAKDLAAITDVIENTIKTVVNGKIDNLTKKVEQQAKKHEDDMAELRPFIQGIAGAKVLRTGFIWLAGLASAYLVLKEVFFK
jgi:hypothetical protein